MTAVTRPGQLIRSLPACRKVKHCGGGMCHEEGCLLHDGKLGRGAWPGPGIFLRDFLLQMRPAACHTVHALPCHATLFAMRAHVRAFEVCDGRVAVPAFGLQREELSTRDETCICSHLESGLLRLRAAVDSFAARERTPRYGRCHNTNPRGRINESSDKNKHYVCALQRLERQLPQQWPRGLLRRWARRQ